MTRRVRGEASGRAGARAVQRDLASHRLSLKMLDCYRPVRASRDMVAWAQDGRETAATALQSDDRQARPVPAGYIAERAGHSTGAAVDLTLVDLRAPPAPAFDPAKDYADCTAPAALRAPEGSVDMGTGYDCSHPKAHTAAGDIAPQQRRWRNILVTAMTRHGFINYAKEWWHFSRPDVGAEPYDFPVPVRRGE